MLPPSLILNRGRLVRVRVRKAAHTVAHNISTNTEQGDGKAWRRHYIRNRMDQHTRGITSALNLVLRVARLLGRATGRVNGGRGDACKKAVL